MTTTATTINRDVNRIKPGDGKLKPVIHIVRIVVVRPGSDSNDAPESDGPGQSHGLTEKQLRAAEAKLKEKDAPPSSDGTSAGQASPPLTMFDVLEPYEIVVVWPKPASVGTVAANPTNEAGQTTSEPKPKPASVRTVIISGKPTRRLFAHDHHHTDTVLRVWTESDTIEYQCDVKFEIKKVERVGWNIYDAPDNPFGSGKVDYKAQERQLGTGKIQYFWKSSELPATANNQQYKMTFTIFDENGKNGQELDPDIVCGNPPPTP